MEQSVVEFLVEQLAKNGILHSSDIAKAKEMEKEQIIDAYYKGDENGANRIYYHDIRYDVSAEQYYKETFKSE